MVTGDQSVYLHLHHFQTLRVWYRDPNLETLRPELRIPSTGPEFLFWVNPDLEVCEVDFSSRTARASGGSINPNRYRSTLRSYAFGLAGSGKLERAVDLLLSIDEPSTWDHAVSYRMAAALRYGYGSPADASEMLKGVPALPPSAAFDAVGNLLTIPTRGAHLEQAAFQAFGFSWQDAETVRKLLRALIRLGYYDVSGRLAHHLMDLVPGDPEAVDALDRVRESKGIRDHIIPPVRRLNLPKARVRP
jgi:hypothetical protein